MKANKTILLSVALVALCLLLSIDANAQCAMCQATAETSRGAGSSVADGINKGVMYLFFTPYLIIGGIGFIWWRARRKAQQAG